MVYLVAEESDCGGFVCSATENEICFRILSLGSRRITKSTNLTE